MLKNSILKHKNANYVFVVILLSICFNIYINFTAKPDAPREPFESKPVTKDSVELSWQQPESDGGSPITGYVIEKRDSKSYTSRWVRAEQTTDNSTSAILKNLIPGTELLFKVAAVNKFGTSDFLEMKKPVTVKSPYGRASVLVTRLFLSSFLYFCTNSEKK